MILPKKLFFASMCTLFFFNSSSSQPELTADEIVAKVQAKYSSQTDVSANFIQQSLLRFSKTEQQQTGTVKIKKGNKFRIETPHQILLTDGKTIWMYTPANEQVIISTYKKNNAAFSVDQFLYGLPKDFTAQIDTLLKNEVILNLNPKSSKVKTISNLKAWIDTNEWTIHKIEYVDANKTKTTVELTGIRFNSGIAENEFIFVIPAGTTIVDTRTTQQ